MQVKMAEKLTKVDFLKLNRKQQEELLVSLKIHFMTFDNELKLYEKYNQMKIASKSIKEMAQELKLNMENVEFGLKTKPKETEEMITKAYNFMKRIG